MSTQREWTTIREYDDILFDYYNGIARITINRERYRNAFTPTTTAEMSDALRICREEADVLWTAAINLCEVPDISNPGKVWKISPPPLFSRRIRRLERTLTFHNAFIS